MRSSSSTPILTYLAVICRQLLQRRIRMTLLLAGLLTHAFLLFSPTALALDKTPQTILVVGDSLSAEYGLQRGTGWVALMQARLEQQGHHHITVVNASISGDTTAGGRARIATAIKQHQPTLIILELGANDALRGLSLQATQANLQAMIQQAKEAKAQTLLLGIQMPPNYGKAYTDQLASMYTTLAQQKGVSLVPFFLTGVADVADSEKYFQADRTHPNAQAHPIILNNIYPKVSQILKLNITP